MKYYFGVFTGTMTRIRPRWRDKLVGALGAVNKKFSTNEDPNDNNIKELEDQIDNQTIPDLESFGPSNQKGFAKQKKSYKNLR